MGRIPAALGGTPLFDTTLDIVKPALPRLDVIAERLSGAMESGRITNNSQYVRELEQLACVALGAKNCVAMCNGTLTLILALKGMGLRGKVVVPSFTFCATVHSVVWAGLEPVFADCDPNTFNITPETVEAVLDKDISAIMPVHIFGSPCDIAGFETLTKKYDLKLIFDSAQAMGSKYRGKMIGSFGDVESFSLHATKILATGEGGLLTTNNDDLADFLRSARNFGIGNDGDCAMPGINAKMAEFPALLGIEGFKNLKSGIERRRGLVNEYQHLLGSIPGIGFQSHLPDTETNYQNIVVLIDKVEFGLSRDGLLAALMAENIMSRKYYYPPIHANTAYAHLFAESDPRLPVTNWLSDRALCLPLFSEMEVGTVEKICSAIHNIHANSSLVRAALTEKS